jgi:predicted nucleic acid-binding protein
MKRSTAIEPLFVDTWGWLVLANDRDPAFAAVAALRRQYAESAGLWITTDYVLDETITRLFMTTPFRHADAFCKAIFESQKAGVLGIEPIHPERFEEAYRLRLRYRDKPRISYTDLTSFIVMRELGIRQVLSADAHFSQVGLGFHQVP